MRRLGWAVVVLAIVGSLGYSAAVLLAVEFGGFFLRLFLRDVPDRSAPAIYLDILIHECWIPLLAAAVLACLLRLSWPGESLEPEPDTDVARE